MAISKQRKQELVEGYADRIKRSQAIILADFRGQPTKSIYQLRTKIRDAQGEFHVVKNTLMIRSLREAGLPVPEQLLQGPTAVAFCFKDAPAVAKALLQFADETKTFVLKGAIMGNSVIDPQGLKALSEMPPRPVVLAQVLGTIQAPGGKVAGVINAALQQIVRVIQARADQLQAAQGAA